jgi:hypothetical protein
VAGERAANALHAYYLQGKKAAKRPTGRNLDQLAVKRALAWSKLKLLQSTP